MTKVMSAMVSEVKKAYAAGQEDEALEPIVAVDRTSNPIGRIQPGDSVIFYDIRGEREVQITESLISTPPAGAAARVRRQAANTMAAALADTPTLPWALGFCERVLRPAACIPQTVTRCQRMRPALAGVAAGQAPARPGRRGVGHTEAERQAGGAPPRGRKQESWPCAG